MLTDYPYKGVLDLLANRCMASGTNAWTDIDHTCYTMTTAGSEGFLSLIPIYLDHILYPLLTDAGFTTEVHHITGEGKDGGVVYCEMQGRENTGESRVNLELVREMYPGHCGYKSETGGIMSNLRDSTTNEKIRAYHKAFYRPENLCLIITGQVEAEDIFRALKPLEEKIMAKGDRGDFTRSWQSPVPPLTASLDKSVPYPCDNEDNGMVYIGWRGPSAVTELYKLTACAVLLKYLTDTPVSPLPKEFVDIPDPYCSEVSSETKGHRMGLLQVANFAGLVVGNLGSGPLNNRLGYHGVFMVSTGLTFLALVYAAFAVRESIYVNENRKRNVFDCELVADMLATCCKKRPYYVRASIFLIIISVCTFLTSLNANNLIPVHKYKSVNTGITVVLGEVEGPVVNGYFALANNLIPVHKYKSVNTGMTVVLGEVEGPVVNGYFALATEAHDDDGLPHTLEHLIFLGSEDYPTTRIGLESASRFTCGPFSHTACLMLQVEPDKFHKGIQWIRELLFETKLDADRIRIVANKIVNDVAQAKRQGNRMARDLLKGLLYNKESNHHSISVLRQHKFLSKVLEQLSSPSQTQEVISHLDQIRSILCHPKNIVVHMAANCDVFSPTDVTLLRQILPSAPHPSATPTTLNRRVQSDANVISHLDQIRSILCHPKNIVVHMAANCDVFSPTDVTLLSQILPSAPHPSATPTTLNSLHVTEDWQLLEPGENQGRHVVVGMGAVESFFMCQAAPAIRDFQDEDLAPLLVFLQYLTQLEGPMWKQIRGLGHAYSYNMVPRPNEGQLHLTFYRATNVVAAYTEAKNIIESHLKPDTVWDPTLFDSAKTSLIFEIIEREKSIGDVVAQSLLTYFKHVSHDYNKTLVQKIIRVTTGDLGAIGQKYLVPLLDPKVAKTSVVCHPTQTQNVRESFANLGFEFTVYNSLEESFLAEL
ncbi:uncharacterized protein C05D11.1 [Diaphorina citri]|uniref:Uncharacterized protein C05D11.1 n=1 Tax=Diaphorina citri TaxID=121845 RepID=A0A3Q0IYX9_DIACI|nr:uncharacterized protein C05D11.1 [Diaphorina citri]